MYTKKNAKRDFKTGFFVGLVIFGALAAILFVILNL